MSKKSALFNEYNGKLNNMLLNNTDALIFILDNNHKIEYANENSLKKINFTPVDLVNLHIKEIIYPEDHKKLDSFLEKLEMGLKRKKEIRLINKSGGFIWFFLKGESIIFGEENKNVLFFREIFGKIKPKLETDKKNSDLYESLSEISFWKLLQPKQYIDRLEEYQEMLQFVIDHIPQFIAWKDLHQNFLGCNINFAKIIGLDKPEQIIGLKNEDLNLDEETIKNLNLRERDVIENQNPEFHSIESWLRIHNEKRWFEVSRIPLIDSNKDLFGLLITFEDITSRREFENALIESEKKFRDLAELLPDMVYTVNSEGIVSYINPAVEEKLGYKPEEIINKMHIRDFFPKDYQDFLKSNFKKVLSGELTEPHEYQMLKKNGSIINTVVTSRPIRENGEVIGLRGIIHDISMIKDAEKKIIESEKKYRNLAEFLPEVIFECDTDLNITYLNSAGFNKFEISKDVFDKGISVVDFIASMDKEDAIEKIKIVLDGQDVGAKDILLKKNDGTYFFGRSHIKAIYKNGEIVGLRGVISDITERKKSEIALKKEISERKLAEINLRKSEEKYRHLFETSPYVIWLVDLNGKILDCNITTNELMSDHTKDDLIGYNFIKILSLLDKSDYFVPFFKESFSQIVEGKELKPVQVKMHRSDGSEMWLNVIGSCIKFGDEEQVQVIIQDITETKKAQEKIKESEGKLKKLNKELEEMVLERTKELRESEKKLRRQNIKLRKLDNLKNEFITHAAHELKTPLISISGFTDYILMKHKEELNDEIKSDLSIIKRNVHRLEKFMDQLLDVMKVDEDKLKLQKEKIIIKELINTCLEELSYLIQEKNHKIVMEIDRDLELEIDKERIFQVFTNLISNAVKFTPENGLIQIISERKNKSIQFMIKDNGLGLESDEIKKLFKKFEIIKSPSKSPEVKYEGTGLGLYISKGIIESHGGKIWAESNGLNTGTTFYFTLPLQ